MSICIDFNRVYSFVITSMVSFPPLTQRKSLDGRNFHSLFLPN